MGISGALLKQINNFDPKVTLSEMKEIMDLLRFDYSFDPLISDPNGFHLGINDPSCNSDFCMYIFDKPKPGYIDDAFSWISLNLATSILIEDLYDSEDSILKILHEYLRLHPDEFFYAEEDWFYNANDINKIYESGDWHHWCYKKPKRSQE